MFGVFTFGTVSWSPSPSVYRAILETSGAVAGAANVTATGAAIAIGTGGISATADIAGGLASIRGAAGDFQGAVSLAAFGSVVWGAEGVLALLTDLGGLGSALVSAAGVVVAEVLVDGVRLRAYDALFPPIVADGSVVQIGKRLYRWRTVSARWSFYMVAPTS